MMSSKVGFMCSQATYLRHVFEELHFPRQCITGPNRWETHMAVGW